MGEARSRAHLHLGQEGGSSISKEQELGVLWRHSNLALRQGQEVVLLCVALLALE